MAIEKMPRFRQAEQNAEARSQNFDEVCFNYDLDTAAKEAARCLKCKNAPCVKGCPVGVQIPQFLEKIAEKDLASAAAVIKETNSLPAVCGRVCPQEEQCEKVCIRRKMDEAVAIGALERLAGDYALDNKQKTPIPAPKKGKVAVVGSGPASLTCAAECAKNGYAVTVFEAFHKAGGVLVYGIPEFRLPKSLVQREIDTLKEMGVTISLNTVIGKTITMQQLKEEFDTVFIGTGAGLPQFLGIPGENLNGVFSANEYLTRANLMKAYAPNSATPIVRGRKVVVLGAGNVAFDAARTALRLGADSVQIVYRRGREELPAREAEVKHAEEEGVLFRLYNAPIEVVSDGNGEVTGLMCVLCKMGEPDSSGRRSPILVRGTEYIIPCDTIIVAIGTSPNPLLKASFPELKVSPRGTVLVEEETLATNIPGVYAGGDAVTGAATVILAMGAGRKAASSMMRYMQTK